MVDEITHPTYRKGSGPGVVVIHEIPGITSAVITFAEQAAARGFTVVLPSLFGREEAPATVRESLRSIARVCVGREFSLFAFGRTSPVVMWLRSLARELHAELDGPAWGPSACALPVTKQRGRVLPDEIALTMNSHGRECLWWRCGSASSGFPVGTRW